MVDILKTKALSSHLTSYDLLKSLALLLMVIDHIGYFFYPEDMWWRTFGRLSVPIWFFLIGYANAREIPKLFWIMAGLVLASAIVAGEYLFPLNIVFTLILARFSVDWLFARGLRNREAFTGMFFFLFLLSVPSLVFLEYGTLGLLFTFIGALRRNEHLIKVSGWMLWSFIAASGLGYILVQGVLLPSLSGLQLLVFVVGMAALSIGLYYFRPAQFERLDAKKFPPLALIQFTGRRTLEFYVLHLVALRGIGMVTDPERFSFLQFDIFAFKQLQTILFGV